MRPYLYRCHDHSLLTPIFKRWLVSPLIRFVPWALPANYITILSNGLVYVALGMAIHPVLTDLFNRLVIGGLLLLYLIGDHLDGMQAKRTGTGSALGEFCDHYLDSFNNGIILCTLLTLFDIRDPRITAWVLAGSYLAHASVFYEQFKTGWLTFERVGSLEGVLLISVITALTGVEFLYKALTLYIYYDFILAEAIVVAASLGAWVTFYKTVNRTPHVGRPFWAFGAQLLLISAVSSLHFSAFDCFLLITLYASFYVGRVMQGHLVDGRERSADWFLVGLLALPYLFDAVEPNMISWIALLYLSIQISILIVRTVLPLKAHWLWINPRPQ